MPLTALTPPNAPPWTPASPRKRPAILDRLDEFRACDLAVGSGAFPVGLLHELLNLRRLCETRSRGKDPVETDSHWLYETKARIIERCLYGVDIQERAIEICKLRLWLSLMVDHPLEADVDSCSAKAFRDALRKITPLPNLDFKIRRANSLVDYIHGEPVELGQLSRETGAAMPLSKLTSAKREFFKARTAAAKRKLRFDIYGSLTELAKIELTRARTDAAGFGMALTHEAAARVAELDHGLKEIAFIAAQIHDARKMRAAQQDEALERIRDRFEDPQNPTFVWQLDFAEVFHRTATGHARTGGDLLAGEPDPPQPEPGHPGGFDLMVGNPPYVRHEKIKDLKPLLENVYACYTGVADLYVYFFERGIKLLREGGLLSFISSNKFFRAGYGAKLRNFLCKNTELRTVIDFGDLPIFEATAYPCIMVASNRLPQTEHEVRTLKVKSLDELARFTDLAASSTTPLPQKGLGATTTWQLESPPTLRLMEKLRSAGTPLTKHVNGRFYYGIKTGLNEAFVVDRATRDKLIAEDKSSAKVLKPFLRGRDLKRWKTEPKDLWLVFIPWHFPRHLDPEVKGASLAAEKDFEDNYPAIFNRLSQFKKQLEARNAAETGLRYQWYALQRWGADYWQEFEQPKILYPDIYERQSFAWDEKGYYPANTCYFIPTGEKWMTGLLNSTTVEWFYGMISNRLRGGYLRAFSDYMEQIPIPAASATERSAIEALVEKCSAARGENCQAWEAEINDRVYRLYGLTKDEIKIVEEATLSDPPRQAAAKSSHQPGTLFERPETPVRPSKPN